MKIKYANKTYEVLYMKKLAGVTMYAVEDEPDHVDWLVNVEVVETEPIPNVITDVTVDLTKELDNWRHNHFHGRRDIDASGEYLERCSQLDLAKHFYELGLKHRKDNNIDYEKKYQEALKRAKTIHDFSSDIAEIKRIEQIFNELQ